MKKLSLLLFLTATLLFSTPSKAQYINLPDTFWRTFLFGHGFSSCINGMLLDTTCATLSSAISLNCSHWNVTTFTGLQYFSNLDTLIIQDNPITTLDTIPSALKYLEVTYCQLTSLPALPNSLLDLHCENNFLSSLPILPNSLINMNLSSNQFTTLTSIPNSVQFLNVNNCPITSLPNFGNNLKGLSVSACPITSLPSLGNNLQFLGATNDQLSSLPPLPQSLKQLWISYNLFTTLPALDDSLWDIKFDHNMITTLDSFPKSSVEVDASFNQLVSIPDIPNGLRSLAINNNFISSLPALPRHFSLVAHNNLIQSIAFIPDSTDFLDITYNPISCLPPCENFDFLSITNTNIRCLPNSISTNFNCDVNLDTFPLCQPSSGCPVYWNISGKIYMDDNLNCFLDSSERTLKQIPVRLDSSGITLQTCFSNFFGDYSFRTPLGSYVISVDTNSIPFNLSCPGNGPFAINLTPIDSIVDSINVGLTCQTYADVAAVSISPITAFIPGSSNKITLNFGNLATNYGAICLNGNDSGLVYVVLSPNINYLSPSVNSLTPTSVNGDSLTWMINNFSTINLSSDFRIDVSTDTTAQMNDPVCIHSGIIMTNDIDSSNNKFQNCFYVQSSFDPNEKWISPSDADSSTYYFTFSIHFQNTGNAPAQNIFILDTLDNDLDATTFEFLNSSHDVVTQLLTGNILRFNYHSIYLPDSSSDEPDSHGFVEFKIKRNSFTGVGTVISNTAAIYFDYNAPVITNTVSATINTAVGISNLHLQQDKLILFPNPTTHELNFALNNEKIIRIEVYNLLGDLVYEQQGNYSSHQKIYLDILTSGLYFVKVLGNKNTFEQKFIKY